MNLQIAVLMLFNAVELMVLNTMLCTNLPQKRYFRAKVLLCAALTVLYIALLFWRLPEYVLIHIPLIVVAFLYVKICYETSLQQALYIGVAAYTVQHISSLLNTLFTYFAPELFAHDAAVGVTVYGYLLILVCDVLTFSAFHLLLGHYFGVPQLKRNATGRVMVVSCIVVLMNQPWTLNMLNTDITTHTHTTYALTDTIWNLIACILSIIIQFDIIHIDRKDTELEATQKLIQEKERQYKVSKSNIEAINRKCHDLKYQLAALSRGEDSGHHITEAMELVESLDSEFHTGNDTLDIIFTEKSQYCKKHDIDFVCMIDGEKLGFIDRTDLYVLFGNIIDNAINAVEKIANHSERSIYFQVYCSKQLLLIRTENPFQGTLEFTNGLPRTTTGDSFNHGFGMTSIRMIAEKYGGSVNTRAESNVFYLNIVIPITEAGGEK